jgi:hypothetical protein
MLLMILRFGEPTRLILTKSVPLTKGFINKKCIFGGNYFCYEFLDSQARLIADASMLVSGVTVNCPTKNKKI